MGNVATPILPASSLPLVADPVMVRLYELVDRLAPVNIPVLITGETGCGKELIATAIHVRSGRAARPLISVNCAALHESLAESELFGHEKGAFSGAVGTHIGLIEAASDSTLFLDEVGELTPSIQAKLLRVLEVHRLTRVGDTRERGGRRPDRGGNQPPARGRRERAAVPTGPVLPTLGGDASPTAASTATERGAAARELVPRRRLPAYGERTVMRAVRRGLGRPAGARVAGQHPRAEEPDAVRRGDAARRDPARRASGRAARPDARRPVVYSDVTTSLEPRRFRPLADEIRDLEILRIRQALEATRGNQTHAAALLEMPVRTFFEKAKQYGLTPKRKPAAERA